MKAETEELIIAAHHHHVVPPARISLTLSCHFLLLFIFDLLTRPKCHSRWCTGKKWHIPMAVMWGNRVGGNWLMKWDEQKIFPWYTHRLIHRKRVTCELHDSYFLWMTIKHSISKIEWASNDYIIQLSSTSQLNWVPVPVVFDAQRGSRSYQ